VSAAALLLLPTLVLLPGLVLLLLQHIWKALAKSDV